MTEWISIKDQRPNDYFHVLFYDTQEKECVGYVSEDSFSHHPAGDFATGAPLFEVTHWMPLPNPPNKA
jgi:heat shock protein HspQ